MTEKLKVGIVGASGWMAGALTVGVEYEENTFDQDKGVGKKNSLSQVTALCDLNKDVMEQRNREWGLDSPRLFTSYDELLISDAVDALVIVVPNSLHVSFAVKAIEAGKHVFLEKPFATTKEDSKKLQESLKGKDLTTKLDYILVHYDEQENLKKLVEQGAFGQIGSVLFTYRHPINVSESEEQIWKLKKEKSGGAIPMGICHAISCAVYQVDSDPVTVIARSSKPKLRAFDYDTQYDIMVVFENGVVGVIQGNIDFAEKYDARHTIIGTEGQFDYTPYNPLESRVCWSSQKLNREYSPDADFAKHHLDSGDVWKHQCGRTVMEFVKHAVKGEKDPLLGLDSPLVSRTEAIIWAAEESAQNSSMPVLAGEYL